MKRLHLLLTALLALISGFYGNIHAQDFRVHEVKVDWKEYASLPNELNENEIIYLCHAYLENDTVKYNFINAGGEYGVYAMFASRGINLRLIVNKDGSYSFSSAIVRYININKEDQNGLGHYMGISGALIALDRKSSEVGSKWHLENYTYDQNIVNEEDKFFGTKALRLKNGTQYLYESIDEKYPNAADLQDYINKNEAWLLIKKSVVKDVILKQKAQGQTLIEVTGLLSNTRFVRNAYGGFWKFYDYEKYITATDKSSVDTLRYSLIEGAKDDKLNKKYEAYISMHPAFGAEGDGAQSDQYAQFFGRFGSAGLKNQIMMCQRIDDVPPGTYIITAQAFFANDEGDTGEKATSTNAYLYASTTDVHNNVRIPMLKSDEQNTFNQFVAKHKTYLGENVATNYFRYNVAAAEFLKRGGKYEDGFNDCFKKLDNDYKLVQVAVMVHPDEGKKTGHLTVSAAKTGDEGRAYIYNVKVYYAGMNEFGVDAYNKEPQKFDDTQYPFPQRFNLRRDFGITEDITEVDANNKTKETHWEPLVLPVNVKVREIRNAFGGFNQKDEKLAEVKLSRLVGLSDDGRKIIFEKVPLDDPDKIAIHAGECYVIKVSAAPWKERADSYMFESSFTSTPKSETQSNVSEENTVTGGGKTETSQPTEYQITYNGPIYYITALTRDYDFYNLITGKKKETEAGTGTEAGTETATGNGREYDEEKCMVTKTYETEGRKLKFTGYFCRPTDSAPKDSYVMSGGAMYHLTAAWPYMTGTCWYLEVIKDPNTSETAKIMSFSFGDEDEDGTTAINGIPAENNVSHKAPQGVYNLSGQKIASDAINGSLPKGIYIMNGKKYVVK